MNTRHTPTGARLRELFVFVSILTSIIATTRLGADVITVDDDGNSDYSSIQAAIDAADNGDEIRVFPGRYSGSGGQVINLRGKAIRIRALNTSGKALIDGSGQRRCIACTSGESSNTLIEGFTIVSGVGGWVDLDGDGREGDLERVGGGALLLSSSPTFSDCVFISNSADIGASVYASNSNGLFVDCTFFNNTAFFGGAISNNDGSSPAIISCAFNDNLAPRGGAIENWNGSNPLISNCTFDRNIAVIGGCVLTTGSNPIITDCTFSNNIAESGGAIYDSGASASSISGCTFISNTATIVGGAIGCFASNPLIRDCSFRENYADFAGGALHVNSNSLVQVIDSTFQRNRATFGGALADRSLSYSVLESCRFERNTAFFAGGSIDNDDSSLVSLADTSFCGSDPDHVHGTWIDEGKNHFAESCSSSGDLDGDGTVDGTDLLVLLANWGPCAPGSRCISDIDSNGHVDGNDLLILLSTWGE